MNETTNILGLDEVTDRQATEQDLVKSLLEAADFRNTEDAIREVEIRRKGKLLFVVRIRPLSDDQIRTARKHATTYAKDPRGARFPRIEKEFDGYLFNSWLIYLATVPEDQKAIWGNRVIMEKYNLMEPVDSIDTLLTFGEKAALLDQISEISGLDEEEPFDLEERAKN